MNRQIWIADGDQRRLSHCQKILSQQGSGIETSAFLSVQKWLKSFRQAIARGQKIPLCMIDADTAFAEAVNVVKALQSLSPDTSLILFVSNKNQNLMDGLPQDGVYPLSKPVDEEVLCRFADALIRSWNLCHSARTQVKNYAAILEDAEIGIWEWRLSSDEWRANDHWFKMTGQNPDAFPVSFETWQNRIHPDDLKRASNGFRILVNGKTQQWESELRFRHASGKWHWFLVRGRVMESDAAGNPEHIACSHLDVSEQKRNTRKMLEVREQFATLFELNPAPMWICEPSEGRFFRINQTFRKKTGCKREEIIGSAFDNFFVLSERDKSRIDIQQPEDKVRMRECGKNGEGRDGKIAAAPVLLNGNPYSMGIFTDFTHIRQMETALSEAKACNERLHQAKGLLLSDIREGALPAVSTITGMIDLMHGTELSFEQSAYLDNIQKNSEVLMGILDNIDDMVKINAGHEEQTAAINFDLRCMIEDIRHQISVQAAVRQFDFTCDVERHVPSLLYGNPAHLRRILLILLKNAIRFTRHGRISLRIASQNETTESAILAFSVRDTGIGIPLKQIAQIQDTLSDKNEGLSEDDEQGISFGLPIVRYFCEKMGGKLAVTSQVGKGTEFCVTAVFQKQRKDTAIFPLQTKSLNDKRVLIVNAAFSERTALQQQISLWGCRVDEAEDGDSALKKMHHACQQSHPFDLVVIDLELPDMEGVALGKSIKSEPVFSHISLIMLTAIGRRGDAQKCQAAGFSAYLVMPFNRILLKDCLGFILHSPPLKNPEMPHDIITRHTLFENRKRLIRPFLISDLIHSKKYVKDFNNMGYRLSVLHSGTEVAKKLKEDGCDMVFIDGASLIIRQPPVPSSLKHWHFSTGRSVVLVGGNRSTQHYFKGLLPEIHIIPYQSNKLEKEIQKTCLMALSIDEPETRPNRIDTLPLIDIAYATDYFEGESSRLRQFIENFIIDSDVMLSEMQEAINLQQTDAVRKMITAYKDKLVFFTDKKITKIAEQIDKAAEFEDINKLERLFLKFVDSYLHIKNNLNHIDLFEMQP